MIEPAEPDRAYGMRSEVKRFAKDVSEIPLEQFVGRERGVGFDYAPLREVFRDYIATATALNVDDASDLVSVFLPDLVDAIRKVHAAWIKLRDFSAASSNRPQEERQELMAAFAVACKSYIGTATPVLAIVAERKAARDVTARGETLRRSQAEVTAVLDELRARHKESGEILHGIRDAAQKVGVTAHAKHFAEEAAFHRKYARYWLVATGVMGVVTVAFAGWNYHQVLVAPPILSATVGVQWIVAKIILFSLLVSAAVWSAKVYRAHQHNAVVNRHRQNALSSFQTFAASASDEQTRNAVLIQATQSIFAPQNTGYATGDSDATPPTQLIELVRTITGGK